MKKITLMLFAFMAFVYSFQTNAQCDYTLEMYDSWGDGWNGNTMDVLVNGSVVLDDVTLSGGTFGSLIFAVNDGDDVTAIWNGGGSYGSETSYSILDATDTEVGSGAESDITTGSITATCPSCPNPLGMTASNVTETSADLLWVAGGSESTWNLEWKAGVDFTPGNMEEDASDLVSGTPAYNANGLSSGTTYYIYYQADCGGGDTSDWVGPFVGSTLCYPLSVPFTEGFNSDSSTQVCWTVLNENADSDVWNLDYTLNPYEGDESAAMYTDINSGNNDDWLISPGITLTGNERLKFQYRVQSSSEPNDFELLLSTTGIAPIDFTDTLVANTSYTNTTYAQQVIDLSSYSGVVYIAWHVPNGGLDGWRLYIDEVIVEEIPACLEPSDLMVSNISSSGADLGWTENGTATAWNVEIVDITAGGSVTGTATDTGVTNPFSAIGLTTANDYEFYVQADCGSGTSVWVGPFAFRTYGDCNSTGTYDYVNNSDASSSIGFVANTPGDYITLTFTSGSTESCCDDWYIMDSADGSGNIIATGAGSIVGAYESTTGEIAFYVDSDGSIQGATFEYSLSCSAPPSCGDPIGLGVAPAETTADISWAAPTAGTPTGYNWEIQPDGVAQGTAGAPASGTVSGTSDTITGLTASTTYDLYVQTDCGGDGTSAWAGPYSFTTLTPPPSNDEPAGAIMLTPGPDFSTNAVTGQTNAGATASEAVDSSIPSPTCSSYGGGDLWYIVTVPSDGNLTIETDADPSGSGGDSGMSVYSGSIGAFVEVGCDDDSGPGAYSQVLIESTDGLADQTLYIRVFEYGNNAIINFQISAYSATLGVNQVEFSGFQYFPNPLDSTLSLRSQNIIDNVSVYNMLGQEVMNVPVDNMSKDLDMSNLSSGNYFVRVSINGAVENFKIVKQ